jgi:hypothetical protein
MVRQKRVLELQMFGQDYQGCITLDLSSERAACGSSSQAASIL